MFFSCVSPHVSVGSAPKHVQEFRTTLLHQNSVCTWTKCTTKSQRIIGSLWWASCAIPHCCQIVACVSKWERRRTQTGSRPAVYSSGWGLCSACVRTLLDMHRRRTCAELSNEILIASSTIQNLNAKYESAENLCSVGTTMYICDNVRKIVRLHFTPY